MTIPWTMMKSPTGTIARIAEEGVPAYQATGWVSTTEESFKPGTVKMTNLSGGIQDVPLTSPDFVSLLQQGWRYSDMGAARAAGIPQTWLDVFPTVYSPTTPAAGTTPTAPTTSLGSAVGNVPTQVSPLATTAQLTPPIPTTIPWPPPGLTGTTTPAPPAPPAPPARSSQEILDSWLKALGGGTATNVMGATTGQTPGPSGIAPSEAEKSVRGWTSVNGLKAGELGYEQAVASAVAVLTGTGTDTLTEVNGESLTDPTKVPTASLPNGYRWSLQSLTKTIEVPVSRTGVDSQGKTYTYQEMEKQTTPTYQWAPEWTGTGAMSDFEKAKLTLDEAQKNADRAQALLAAAVKQGNDEQTFAAQQQVTAANQALQLAEFDFKKAEAALAQSNLEKQTTQAQSQWEKEFGLKTQAQTAAEKQAGLAQSRWEKEFASTEQAQAFDKLVKVADLAANPRDFVKTWLLQGNPWYKDIVGQVVGATPTETGGMPQLNIAPPSQATYGQLTPSEQQGFASVLSSQGVPFEDYMTNVMRKLWPQRAAPTTTTFATAMQR